MIFKKNCYKVIRSNSNVENYLITVAIGKKYFDNWKNSYSKNWLDYCKKNNLGLIVFNDDLIEKNSVLWKHPTWQRLLVPKYLSIYFKKKIKNICLLDADIIINANSNNIFDFHKNKTISYISLYKDLPYKDTFKELRKKIVFYRKNYMNKKYPLQSSILGSPNEIYKNYKFPKIFNDYFCAGVLVFNSSQNCDFFLKIFFRYYNDKRFIGVEVPLNYEIFNNKKINKLNYKFQTIWLYELAYHYTFLYRLKKINKIKNLCVQQSLLDNYFIHFAGSWPDTKSSKYFKNPANDLSFQKLNNEFSLFKKLQLKAKFYKKKFLFK